MKKIIILLFASLLFPQDALKEFTLDPFAQKETIKYSLNDIRNYPIGIIELDKKYFKKEVIFDRNFKTIKISQFYNNELNGIPYYSSFDNYINKLFLSNQRFNLNQKFLTPSVSDSSKNSNDSFMQIAALDLGVLGKASLRVQGNVNIIGKLVNQDQELIRSSFRDKEKTNFKFDQKQQLDVQGKIGDRVTVSLDQNSERDFDWENTIRVDYEGDDDDIIQRLELGNITLSLPSTEFVTFSGNNQGLFGFKATSKLGPLNITSIASVERTKKQTQKYKGTSELKNQLIQDFDYRKNLYFFIHEWFRNGSNETVAQNGYTLNIPSYYPLIDGLHQFGNIVVRNFELYKIDSSNNPQADPGTAYIDPNDISQFADQSKEGAFIRLERGSDYTINEDLGFIRMNNTLQNEIIAAHYEIVDRVTGELVIRIGQEINEEFSSLSLKMIKAQSSHPNHPVWDLMFKNVYSLGSTNVDSQSLEVQIIDNFSTPISDRTDSGETFLNLFGLDNFNQTGSNSPDEIIDYNNPNIVDLIRGEIHLPSLLPFVAESNIEGGNSNSKLESFLQEGKMYTSSNRTDFNGDSRFIISANYTNPKSSINLGFTLVEGSEEIFYNGDKLERGKDYQIDYFSGVILLTTDIDPNSDLEISYDKHDLVTFDRKMMIGSRAQIDFSQNSFLGFTALYYNQDIVNKKVEIGYEPTQNLIFDINGRFENDLEMFSARLKKLNFVNSDKISNFAIEGEIAQVLPNPNSISNSATGDPDGVAYIDDFEGSKRITNPSIVQRFWNISSAPIDSQTLEEKDQRNRLKMYWYNPYSQVLTNSIWPNVSTSQRAQNLTTDILVLNYEPHSYQANTNPDSLWAGIISPMFIGDYDQTRSRFFEIWLRGDQGKLTIDLGKISEDFNGDGRLNTEDIPTSGLALGNGFLEDNEDTGLDGCFDSFENGFGGCLDESGFTFSQYLNSGEANLINSLASISDPNNDNWNYVEGSQDYSNVNGTEGNGTGDRIQAGGKYPDTEDLDQSGFLDKANNYFTKTISLEDTTYVAGSTEINGSATGWKLLRIPLSHFTNIQDISLSEIKYLRLAVSGTNKKSKLEIAKIELVGNTWKELGTSYLNENVYSVQDSTFMVSVVNDEDNPDYIPPKGVFGEYDQINEIRSKEQSLVLKFDNLDSNSKGAATKIIVTDDKKNQSFLMYDRMKMFVYGNSDYASKDDTEIKFFIEFGNGEEYYKLTQPVYSAWDEDLKRNEINIDLDWLTSLKNQTYDSIQMLNANDTFIDSLEYKRYNFNNENKKVEIFGNPSLSRIKYFNVGVENESNHPISGEVWLDELRLSGVKKEKGTALRFKSKFNLADFSQSTLSYNKKDANFHVLQERVGSNQTMETISFNNNLQLGQLFPKKLGISFPLNINYSSINNAPKFFPGTDIRTNNSPPDSVIVKSNTTSFSGKISKKLKSENPLIKYSIDNLSGGFNLSSQKKSDVIMESVEINKLRTNVDYSHRFNSDNYIEAFKWLNRFHFISEEIKNAKLFYTPTTFSSGIVFNKNLSEKMSRRNADLIEDFNLGLERKFILNYKLFDNTQFSYNKNVRSDLSDYRDEVLSELKRGSITNSNESFTYSFNPQFMGWFKPNFSYNSNYLWSKPLNSIIDAANINFVSNSSINFSLSPTEIIESFYTPVAEKNKSSKQRTRSTGLEVEDDTKNANKTKNKNLDNNLFMERIYAQSKKIEPLTFTINNTRNEISNGINGDVPLAYRFGLKNNLGIQSVGEVGLNTGSEDYKKSLNIRSGIRFNQQTSLNFTFNESISSNINGYNIDIRSISRNYIAFGDYLSKGFPFTSWSFRLNGFNSIKALNKIIDTMSFEHALNGNQNLSWKFDDEGFEPIKLMKISSFDNDYNDYLQFSRISRSFSPLLGISTTFKNGISTNIRGNLVHTLDEVPNGMNHVTDSSILSTFSYNFSKGIKFSIPFIERNIFLKNNINISINFDVSNKKEEGSKDKINFVEQNFSKMQKSVIRITYSLTDDVTGSLFFEYREDDSRLTGKRTDQDFGINLNIAIRG